MRHRLRRHEKEEIRRRYKDNAIYKAFAAPCKKYEAQATGFRLSPEELFWECMAVLDDIKEASEDARFALQEFWSGRVVDYGELNGGVERERIEEAASMVTLSVVLCLSTLDLSTYNTLSMVLAGQLNWDSPAMVEMREHLTSNIYRLGEDVFSSAVEAYMDSDEYVSDDIEELLDELPLTQVEVADDDEQPAKSADQLTVRQLIILFEQLLNVSLDSSFTNISALATLIEKVSGYKASSIRTTINDLARRGYDSAPVRSDIERLATLVKKVKPQLSEQLRNSVKE
ncbi:MAG: hypothetical protein J1E58_00660 [Prevotella sp.]|nr:hypothetical protein [Prevotella sp.]